MRVYHVSAFYEYGNVFATGEHCIYSTRAKAEAKLESLIKKQEHPSAGLSIVRSKNKVTISSKEYGHRHVYYIKSTILDKSIDRHTHYTVNINPAPGIKPEQDF